LGQETTGVQRLIVLLTLLAIFAGVFLSGLADIDTSIANTSLPTNEVTGSRTGG